MNTVPVDAHRPEGIASLAFTGATPFETTANVAMQSH
jgi:hypothetical protein